VIIDDISRLGLLAAEIPEKGDRLIKAFWPGKLTLVFKAKESVPESITANTGKIGIRLPEHPVAVALVRALKKPLTATSANPSGMPGIYRIADLEENFKNQVELILDAGELKGGPGSTVIDVTINPPVILREGEVSTKELMEILGSDQANGVDKKR
jgi:L-threonylcarbamoyladenylate synthase